MKFSTTLRDSNLDYVVGDRNIVVHSPDISLSLDEAIEIINKAEKIDRHNYGYEVFSKVKDKNLAIYFRFGNEKTKLRESALAFIRKNWEG